MTSRMKHNQICKECYREFEGFEHQHTCWFCINIWLNTKPAWRKTISEKNRISATGNGKLL